MGHIMIFKNDEYWMHRALELAYYAKKQNEVPVGAVLIQDKKLIGEGWNQSIIQKDPTAHAEIIALRQGGKVLENYRLLNTVLYVTLEPCIMCLGALLHSRITRLVYGAKDNKTGSIDYVMKVLYHPEINHKIKINNGVLAKECATVLVDFFRICRKKS